VLRRCEPADFLRALVLRREAVALRAELRLDLARVLRRLVEARLPVRRFAAAPVVRREPVLVDFRARVVDFFFADAVRDRFAEDLRAVPDVLPEDFEERPVDLRFGNFSLGAARDA
jgi:hypothetical protein